MTKQEAVEYLRNQAFWIHHLADEIENGQEITCDWCIDLELPKYDAAPVSLGDSVESKKTKFKGVV